MTNGRSEELYQEQVKNFKGPDGKFRSMTYDELRELPILDSVIRETLRLHPPIHSILRKVRDDVPVPPTLATPSSRNADQMFVIPKGHFVLASPLISQVDPKTWRDPLKWEPTRWSDPEGVAAQAYNEYYDEKGEKIDYGFGAVSKGTDSPYQPFGAGRHRCIGEQVRSALLGCRILLLMKILLLQFAYLQLGTILSTIIRNVELRLDQKMPGHNYHVCLFPDAMIWC